MISLDHDTGRSSSLDAPVFTEEEAREFFEERRWPGGPRCVRCRSAVVARLQGESSRAGLLQCLSCRRQFTVKVGTIMEDSRVSLSVWARVFFLLTASTRGMN